MPATVPLTSPVTSIAGARALAESVALADGEQVGAAVDRIVLFLGSLAVPALARDRVAVDDVLDLLAGARAHWAAGWLARHADGPAEASFWSARTQLVAA